MKYTAKKSYKRKSRKFICALALLCSCALVQAEVLPKTARLIPPETVLLVDVDNFSRLKQQFEKTNLYKLYKDPAMAAFIDDTKTKCREKIRELDNEIVRAIVDTDVLPQGRVAVALVFGEQPPRFAAQSSSGGNEPIVLFITQWGENISKIKETIDKMVRKAVEEGSHRKTEDYRGVSIETITPDLIRDENPSMLSYSLFDDCLIASANLPALKFVIAHIKGATSPTLAGDADYAATIAAVGPYHDIDFYVNIKQIIKTVIAKDTTGKAQATIANLGLHNVAAVGCSVGIGRSPNNSCGGKAFLKIEGGKKGVLKMLEVESAVLRAPRFIPASTYSVTFLNLNIKKAYNELYSILYNFSPAAAAMMHAIDLPDSPDGEPGLQLKDVVEHLGSQIVIAQSTNKPFSSSSMPTESLVALAVVNPRALEKSLSLLHSKMIAPNNPEARRELLGHTIYLISLPALPFFKAPVTPMQDPAGPTVPQMPTMAFTVTDTHLIFGVESSVEQAIRTLSSTEVVSVGSATWFNNAKSAIPSVVGLACLQNDAASGELFWWMIKESGKAKASAISTGTASFRFGPQEVGKLVNFSLLPEFDAVRKYFGLSAFYGISRPDGFFFEFEYLNPPATD